MEGILGEVEVDVVYYCAVEVGYFEVEVGGEGGGGGEDGAGDFEDVGVGFGVGDEGVEFDGGVVAGLAGAGGEGDDGVFGEADSGPVALFGCEVEAYEVVLGAVVAHF